MGSAIADTLGVLLNEIRITKIQAAQRQIDFGIRMLFRNEDPVAIHTVVMAGFRVLRDLTKRRGLKEPIESILKPGKEKEFWGGISNFSNFCKHADRDPNNNSISFREDANDSALIIATMYYRHLGCQLTNEMQLLWAWYVSLHPDILSEEAPGAMRVLVHSTMGNFRSSTRKDQLAIRQWVLNKVGTSF